MTESWKKQEQDLQKMVEDLSSDLEYLNLELEPPNTEYNPLKVNGSRSIFYDHTCDKVTLTRPAERPYSRPLQEETMLAILEANGYANPQPCDKEGLQEYISEVSQLPTELRIEIPSHDSYKETRQITEMMNQREGKIKAIFEAAKQEYEKWDSGKKALLEPLTKLDKEIRKEISNDFELEEEKADILLPEGYGTASRRIRNGDQTFIKKLTVSYGPLHEAAELAGHSPQKVKQTAIEVLKNSTSLQQTEEYIQETRKKMHKAIEKERAETEPELNQEFNEINAAVSVFIDSYLNGSLEYNFNWRTGELLQRSEEEFSTEVSEKLQQIISSYTNLEGPRDQRIIRSIEKAKSQT